MTRTNVRPPDVLRAASAFTLASGFSALVYEVLWLKELGLLFGNTAHASAVGLAMFFAGLAAGGWFWGRRISRHRRPLVVYAWLEVGIAGAAVPFFWLSEAYRSLYAPLFEMVGSSPALFTGMKAVLAMVVLFPPAFFMGGTMPVLGEVAIPHAQLLARRGAWLYSINTLGAALGAFAAGFYLPAAFGFRRAVLAAVAINLAIAAAAFVLASRAPRGIAATPPALPRRGASSPDGRQGTRPALGLCLLAASSGFLVLALQVAATRLFAQVLQNSVYTFSTILVAFLLALAAGSLLASRLARATAMKPWTILAIILTAAGIAAGVLPVAFYEATNGLQYLGAGEGWVGYVMAVFGTALLVLGPVCVVAGIAFPFLLRLAQHDAASAGAAIGGLSAWNTAGAIAGSVITGFVLLPGLGLWTTFAAVAATYVLAAAILLCCHAPHRAAAAAPIVALLALFAVFTPTRLPLLRVDAGAGEQVLDVRESAYGITAVVARERDRLIKVNNFYSLGGSGSLENERNQALLPLMVHPQPRSVFFIGMGTGITAGAAVQPPVERLVVAELIPDVVAAARGFFGEFANGLFHDPRVEIVTADGRNHLAAVRDRHDMVIADLFVPWEAGTGSLYTHEHFTIVRERLTANGVFVQWLPLYQMSRAEFLTIARTMLDVFPEVVLWRGDFFPERPIVALVGAVTLPPLDPAVIARRGREIAGRDVPDAAMRALTLPFYVGHLSVARQLLLPGPINRDDRPVIEYAAPITHRQQRTGEARWFNSLELLAFFADLLQAVPPERDPYLARLDDESRQWVRAGYHRHAAAVHRRLRHVSLADEHMAAFESLIPPSFRPPEVEEPADRTGAWERPSYN